MILFQHTLTGPAAKWYIELPRGTFTLFDDLAMTFLNHFQLPVRYDVGTELLSTFWQDKATHISDHIQEWCRRKRLIKAFIPPEFLLKWFLKSLLPYIAKDVSTSIMRMKCPPRNCVCLIHIDKGISKKIWSSCMTQDHCKRISYHTIDKTITTDPYMIITWNE